MTEETRFVSPDLDCSDLDEVRRRAVEPAVQSLIRPDELDSLTLQLRPPTHADPAFEHDDPEVWLVLVARGERFESNVCKATSELWEAAQVAARVYDELVDWLPETGFAWGEQRDGEYLVPPATG